MEYHKDVVLVVEDIPIICTGAVDLLVAAGCEALEAGSADEAIRRILRPKVSMNEPDALRITAFAFAAAELFRLSCVSYESKRRVLAEIGTDCSDERTLAFANGCRDIVGPLARCPNRLLDVGRGYLDKYSQKPGRYLLNPDFSTIHVHRGCKSAKDVLRQTLTRVARIPPYTRNVSMASNCVQPRAIPRRRVRVRAPPLQQV
jgi:hypothetical protein